MQKIVQTFKQKNKKRKNLNKVTKSKYIKRKSLNKLN